MKIDIRNRQVERRRPRAVDVLHVRAQRENRRVPPPGRLPDVHESQLRATWKVRRLTKPTSNATQVTPRF